MKRERIEDLGVLSEKLSNLLDCQPLDDLTFYDHFAAKYFTPGEMEKLFNQLQSLRSELCECWHIARWGDEDE